MYILNFISRNATQREISTQKERLPYGDDDGGCGQTHYTFIILFNYSLVNQMRVKPKHTRTQHSCTSHHA